MAPVLTTIDGAVEAMEIERRLRRVQQYMSRGVYVALLLRIGCAMEYREIGDLLGYPPRSTQEMVRQGLHRAARHIREAT